MNGLSSSTLDFSDHPSTDSKKALFWAVNIHLPTAKNPSNSAMNDCFWVTPWPVRGAYAADFLATMRIVFDAPSRNGTAVQSRWRADFERLFLA